MAETKTRRRKINHPSLRVEESMANRVGQEIRSSVENIHDVRNSFGTPNTPPSVKPVTKNPKISARTAQGRTLLERAASVQQELGANRNGKRSLIDRLILHLNSDSEDSIGDSGDSSSSSESVESEIGVWGQDDGSEKSRTRRQNVGKRFSRNLSSSPEAKSAAKRPKSMTLESRGSVKDWSSKPATAGLPDAKLKTQPSEVSQPVL